MLLLLHRPDIGASSVMSAIACIVLLAVLFRYVRRVWMSPLSKFPGPRLAAASKLYEVYHMLVKNDWYETLEKLHQKYGPVVRIGPNELHFVDAQFNLRHHQRTDLFKCDTYYGILDYLLGGFAHPEDHKKRKAIMQPLYASTTLNLFCSFVMHDQIETLRSKLSDAIKIDSVVNMTYFIWAFTNDVMISYAVGEHGSFLQAPSLKEVHDRTRAFSSIDSASLLRASYPLKKLVDFFPRLRSMARLDWIDRVIGENLQAIVAGEKNSNVLSKVWSELEDERVVTHEMTQTIFIGNESLLSNLSFLIHYMVQNPDCIEKLRAELDTLDTDRFGNQIWRDPKLIDLKYLYAVCRESTRMSAPGWHRQPRQAKEPIEYQGMIIPPMTSMSFTLRMLEHDPTLYADPHTFRPERWLDDDPENHRKTSVTFGTGDRTCLGQNLARHVLRKTIAALVYSFDMEFVDAAADAAAGYKYLATYPKKGHEGFLKLRLTPRFEESM